MKIKDLKSKSHSLKPTIQIGKAGITSLIIEEIKVQLKKKKLVKIKILKTGKNDKLKILAKNLADQSDSKLIKQVGGTITLHKK